MTTRTVHQVAQAAGISVRTLHHYDQIGLLGPRRRSESNYRLYDDQDVLRLQQILFYRELDVPLDRIGALLDDPGFDPVTALREHRQDLEQRIGRLTRLLHTIDRTIHDLQEDTMTLTDDELFEGLNREQMEGYQREAEAMWGDSVRESTRRIRSLSKAHWQAVKQEGDDLTRALAALMDRPPEDKRVQEQVARHHAWLCNFWEPTPEQYRALGQGYAIQSYLTAVVLNLKRMVMLLAGLSLINGVPAMT